MSDRSETGETSVRGGGPAGDPGAVRCVRHGPRFKALQETEPVAMAKGVLHPSAHPYRVGAGGGGQLEAYVEASATRRAQRWLAYRRSP